MSRVAVTGATGHLGGRVAALLSDAGVPLRLVVRSPERAPRLPDAEVARASFGDLDAVKAALDGIDVALMVSAAESADRLSQHETFVRAAAAAGVKHLVYTSFAAAAPDATFTLARDHWATERAIADSGMDFTIVRDNFYADVLPFYAADGVIRGPAGDGRCSFVARDDIADAVAVILRDPSAHAGEVYTFTGPESLSFAEACRIMSEATGREFRFVDETDAEAYESRRAGWPGEPDWQYDAWVSTYTAIRSGELAEVIDDLPRLLGRPATPLRALAVSFG
jgi:uncharacterized protein YbjT (DUF2867 family)